MAWRSVRLPLPKIPPPRYQKEVSALATLPAARPRAELPARRHRRPHSEQYQGANRSGGEGSSAVCRDKARANFQRHRFARELRAGPAIARFHGGNRASERIGTSAECRLSPPKRPPAGGIERSLLPREFWSQSSAQSSSS